MASRRRVVVGVDEEGSAVHAVDWAVREAAEAGEADEVHLVYVIQRPQMMVGAVPPVRGR